MLWITPPFAASTHTHTHAHLRRCNNAKKLSRCYYPTVLCSCPSPRLPRLLLLFLLLSPRERTSPTARLTIILLCFIFCCFLFVCFFSRAWVAVSFSFHALSSHMNFNELKQNAESFQRLETPGWVCLFVCVCRVNVRFVLCAIGVYFLCSWHADRRKKKIWWCRETNSRRSVFSSNNTKQYRSSGPGKVFTEEKFTGKTKGQTIPRVSLLLSVMFSC